MDVPVRELIYVRSKVALWKVQYSLFAACACADLNVHKHDKHFADIKLQISFYFFVEIALAHLQLS